MPQNPRRVLAAFALIAALAPAPVLADEDAGAYLAAHVAGADRDYTAASLWFTRALIGDPNNTDLMSGAIEANLALGKFEQAAVVARQFQATGKKNEIALLAIIADQAKKGEFDDILTDAKAGKTENTLLAGLINAWAEFGAGRMSDASAGFDKLAQSKDIAPIAAFQKALALAAAGDFEGSDKIFAGPLSGPLHSSARAIIAHAQVLSQLERNDDALKMLNTVFVPGQDPGIDALRARLEARETVPFDIVRTASDGIAEVFFTIAGSLLGQPEPDASLLYARIAAYLRPGHTEAVLMTGGILSQMGQNGLATEVYTQIPNTDPAFHIAEMGRANALTGEGKNEAAIEVLQALGRSHPKIIAVQKELGDALRREEKFAEAVPAYDAAIALTAPGQTDGVWILYYSRGICLERSDQWDKAEADMRMALKLQPDQPQVLNYLGYSFLEKNINLDEALTMIERAAKAEPKSGAIIDSLAWAYFRLGRYADAVAPMERASLLEPLDPVVTDHLGDVYWAVGRRIEAEFQWHRALSFKPEDKDAARIQRKLDVGLDAVLAEEGAKPLPAVDAAANSN